MVPSTMISMLGSNSRVATLFIFIFCIRRFLTVPRFLPVYGSRFALSASGVRRLLGRAKYISAPCGWEQGVKWGHIRVASGPDGIGRAYSRVLFGFPASMEIFPKLIYLPYGALYWFSRPWGGKIRDILVK